MKYIILGINIILFLTLGVIVVGIGWKFHNYVLKSYDCIPCTIFDDNCQEGWNSEENRQCQDAQEWPWKISMMIVYIGFIIMAFPILIFFCTLFDYFYKSKKNLDNERKEVCK